MRLLPAPAGRYQDRCMREVGKYRNAAARCQLFARRQVDSLLAALFPWGCALCGAKAAGIDLCSDCLQALPWLAEGEQCFRLPGADGRAPGCTAALAYAAPVDRLVTGLKYRRERHCGRVLGEMLAIALAERAATRPVPVTPDCLVPVPLHPRRLRERGYNQAVIIATTLESVLGIPVATDLLSRSRDTGKQVRLGRRHRLRNPQGAFVAAPAVGGLRIALVDDVVTTGATLAGCGAALNAAGVVHCEAWVVARTFLHAGRAPRFPQAVSGSKV